MPDLTTLGARARADANVVPPLPLETLRRRADQRHRHKRLVGASVAATLVVVAIAGLVAAGRHQPVVTAGPDPAVTVPTPLATTSPTTVATEPPPTSSVAPTTTVEPPTTTAPPPAAAATTPSTAAPPASLDPHGLSTDGLRPVTFDMTADQVQQLLGRPVPANGSAAQCGAPETRHLLNPFPGVDLVFPGGGTLRFIGVSQPGVTTLSGIGVGTPIATLVKTLPTAVRNDDNGRLVYTVFNGDHSRSIAFFSNDRTTVTNMLAGVGDMTKVLDYC